MLTTLFILSIIALMGSGIVLALRGAWGFTKILLTLVFFPFVLIGMVIGGLVKVALPLLFVYITVIMLGNLKEDS